MKKILIALDYDSAAQKVAEMGYDLAKAMNGTAVLLHVISDANQYSYLEYSPVMGFSGFSNANVAQKDNEELEKMALEYLNQCKKHLHGGSIETIVRNGVFGETIIAVAVEMNVDLIVMGTHGRRGLEKMFLGSVAENVLH